MKTALHDLADLGQSPWLDGIGHGDLLNGGLVDLMALGVRGLTITSALLMAATATSERQQGEARHPEASDASGDLPGEARRDLPGEARRDLPRSTEERKAAYLELAVSAARKACTKLEGAVPEPGPRDGWVSLEVDPRFAHDVRSTVEEAYRLHQAVDHPRFYVRIPGTVQGMVAIEEATALGVRVDVSLLFSVFRHRQAAEAYLRGLRRLRDSGGDLRTMSSVASFFVSRLDTVGDEALRAVGGDPELTGRLALANAKIAYRTFKDVFSGVGWEELARARASPQWLLWASTLPEDPVSSDVKYVEGLIGADTVTTMSRATLDAFLDHGRVTLTLEDGVEEAGAVLDGFRRAGVDYDTLTGHLEKTAVRELSWSFAEMLKEPAAIRSAVQE
jgi:transaldolase